MPSSWLDVEDMHMKAMYDEDKAMSSRHVAGTPHPIPARRMLPVLPIGTHLLPASPQRCVAKIIALFAWLIK